MSFALRGVWRMKVQRGWQRAYFENPKNRPKEEMRGRLYD
jgi:hypothetical protein